MIMIVDEPTALDMLRQDHVFLLEPPYRRKYLPLGIAKMATYVKRHGGRVTYGRHYDGQPCDTIAITSLFTYDADIVQGAICQCQFLAPSTPILVGGIYASLMPQNLPSDVHVFRGYSKILDQCVPDHSLDYGLREPWGKFSAVFTTRGCPNRCKYCAVWRLEPDRWINPTWKQHIIDEKPYVMLSDNNLSSIEYNHFADVTDFLVEIDKPAMFDNGFDCKYISPEIAARLARLRFVHNGLRLAFDRMEDDGVFQRAVELLLAHGAQRHQIMAFVLFNFTDTPREANYRMSECLRLGIRPYPAKFVPLNSTMRDNWFVGKHWTRQLVRVFRHFWLMAGLYKVGTFEEYIANGNLNLSDKDIEAYHT